MAAGGTLSLPRKGWMGTARDRQPGDRRAAPSRAAALGPGTVGRICRANISSIVSPAQKPLFSPPAGVSQPASFCLRVFGFFS